ncbi:hypothetical protein I3842_Q036900 [Carya illinoinensis]|uniref:NADH-plastoquinone oxidoreductase subunit 1 n=1 Tax=Carya illinoinensis TaxID=32201 RepID=A0A922A4D1_CARIL|nr:hypothetical protein I3842_Q036900 [Carya illinoinensis]
MTECERLPFDLPEAEEELVAGYQTEYSGIKFGLFYVASYLNLLVSSLFVTVLYLGGWNISIPYIFVSELFEINKARWPKLICSCSFLSQQDGLYLG